MNRKWVLIVEDVPDMRATLSGLLLDEGYHVCAVSSRSKALEEIGTQPFRVAVLDIRLDEANEDNRDGLNLMHEIKEIAPNVAVIILTGYADVPMVREALEPGVDGKAPAFAFLEKSELDKFTDCVNRAFRNSFSITDLIELGENEFAEFKSSLKWDYRTKRANKRLPEAIAVAIVGMLNSSGGILLIGIADDGKVLGLEKDLQTINKHSLDGFALALTDIVKTYLGIEYMPYIQTRFEYIDGKSICVVSIQKSPKPVFITQAGKHEFWVRLGNSTRSLDVKEAMEYKQVHWPHES